MATAFAQKAFKNYINGEWVEARSGKSIENRNPANREELVGMFPASSAEDVASAVDAAKAAYKKWRLTPAPKRAEILFRGGRVASTSRQDRASSRRCRRSRRRRRPASARRSSSPTSGRRSIASAVGACGASSTAAER